MSQPLARSGPQLALEQLSDLERVTDGAVEVLGYEEDRSEILIALDTHGIPPGPGIQIRAREQFRLWVDAAYPFSPPTVFADHRRWRATPHVQWGRLLCLYAATAVEWNPADGMRGFLDRLITWLERAAEGTLDPGGQPLHPPVTYTRNDAGAVIVHPDLGPLAPWHHDAAASTADPLVLYGWCVRRGSKAEIVQWLTIDEAYDRVVDADQPATDESGHRCFLVPVLLLDAQIGWEYPDSARALAAGLDEAGYRREALLADLTRSSRLNRALRTREGVDPDLDPTLMLLATPSRSRGEGVRLPHVTAWKVDDLGSDITSLLARVNGLADDALTEQIIELANNWLGSAAVNWMRVHEMRPEVTNARDDGTPLAELRGKRVLLLGCGALGAPVAEHCIRAGVDSLVIVDNGVVTPGVLTRQPYAYADINSAKARTLTRRLNKLTRQTSALEVVSDAIPLILDPGFDATEYDLIIDATAHVGVRAALERTRWPQRDSWPAVLTMIIGHRATRGLVTVSRPGATGAGQDILRRVALRARDRDAARWRDVADDFFPDPPRTEMFFPEPGCSAPTFVGSSAEVAALAATMLTHALNHLHTSGGRPMSATAVRLATDATTTQFCWDNDLVTTETSGSTEIRISREALAEMRTEVRRGARVRGPSVETGGMALGAFDDATNVVYVDVATGPSPDSLLSPTYFHHGVEGNQAWIDHHRDRSHGDTGFVGIWHTHPRGRAKPSATDEAGMATLTNYADVGNRAMMLILAGQPQAWSAWLDQNQPPNVYARMVRRDASTSARQAAGGVQAPPPHDGCFPGGFAYPKPAERPIPWWRRLRRQRRRQ
ncbi:MAG: ThiF family adenylyltransferase [Actinomycetota bacterium]|nr:ThiF family adenylyltransferase [Actinomycetota bacterium]